jgi:ELWxxDGT repeat protein
MLRLLIEKARTRLVPPWFGLGLLAAIGLFGSAEAQLARRVANLNTAPGGAPRGGFSVATVGDRVYFTLADEANGTELWSTDGTAQDTKLVIDLQPGPDVAPPPGQPSCASCGGPVNPYPTGLVRFHDALFFRAGDGTWDATLWRTDGSAAGTTSLDHDESGNAIRNPSNLTVAGTFLYFFANDRYPSSSVELWRTDGTIAGTKRLHRFESPDAPFFSSLFSGAMSPLGNTLLFAGYDAQHGAELWKSDGTPEGTGPVADLKPGAASSDPSSIVTLDDHAFFLADDGTHGRALWMTDAKTVTFVYSFPDNPAGVAMRESGVFKGRLYFTYCPNGATCSLWKSDGTSGGTQILLAGHDATALSPAASGVVFAAGDTDHGRELWVTDGTVEGTRLLRDLRSGPESSFIEQFFELDGLVYFSAYDGTDYQAWRTDGTEAGTVPLGPPAAGSIEAAVGFRHGAVLLTQQGYGQEQIWVTDGSRAGTAPLTPASPDVSSRPDKLAALGNVVLFSANATSGTGLFRSDGSADGTTLVQSLIPTSEPISGSIVALGEKAAFLGATAAGYQIFASDGTPAGTFPLGIAGGDPRLEIVTSGASAFFRSGCCGLWKTDGTVAGTIRLMELPLNTYSNRFYSMTSWRGGIAFITDTDLAPPSPRLWVSDGTAGGTSQVSDVYVDHFGREPYLAALGDLLLFASRGTSGAELWRSDGTSPGTARVAVLPFSPGAAYAYVDSFVRSGPFVFFRLVNGYDSGDTSQELWRTDGTDQGTIHLAQFPNSRGFFDDVSWLTDVAGTLFFSAPDLAHGAELWKSDGTPQGTALVADIRSGKSPSAPQNLAAIGGLLVFTASDGEHGLEPWVSNGTAAGTRMLQDLDPGPSSSAPSGFVAAGGRLFFAANDREAGRELWSMPLASLAGISRHRPVAAGPVGGVPVRVRR